MDKKTAKLKMDITSIIGQLSKIYKEISSKENDSYLVGKKEAYDEILNWFITNHNGDLRYVSANSFLNMIQEKLNKVKLMINKVNEESEDEIINIKDIRELKQINFSDLKINDSKKRINRFAQDQSLSSSNLPLNTQENHNIQFSFFNPFLSYVNSNSQNNTLNILNQNYQNSSNSNIHLNQPSNNITNSNLNNLTFNNSSNHGILENISSNSSVSCGNFPNNNQILNNIQNVFGSHNNNTFSNQNLSNDIQNVPNTFGLLQNNSLNQQPNLSNTNSNSSSLSKKKRK